MQKLCWHDSDGRHFVLIHIRVLLNIDCNGDLQPAKAVVSRVKTKPVLVANLLQPCLLEHSQFSSTCDLREFGMARLSRWLAKCLLVIGAMQVSSVTGQSGEEATVEEGEVIGLTSIHHQLHWHCLPHHHPTHPHQGDFFWRRRLHHSVWRLLLLWGQNHVLGY